MSVFGKIKKIIIIKSVYNINEPSNEVIIENHNKYILFFIETKWIQFFFIKTKLILFKFYRNQIYFTLKRISRLKKWLSNKPYKFYLFYYNK